MRRSVLLALALTALTSLAFAQDRLEVLQRDIAQLQSAKPTAASERNLPLALLAVKKSRLLGSGQFTGVPDNFANLILKQGEAAVARAKAGEAPLLVPGKLNELAYVTANDGTVQPYYLYVPSDYTPDKKWPLIVFLHGYVPSISVLDPWIPSPEQCALAGAHGCLLLVPYGRRNTDFQGIGEVDVLASMAEVCKWYPVDQDRLYLTGVSMGGMGAWNIGLHHPGLFAAVTPMCGQTDMYKWWRRPREEASAWERPLVEVNNAVDNAPNLRGQNFFVQHGEQDNLIPIEQTKLMLDLGEQLGTPIKHYFFPGESHYIYFRTDSFDNAWAYATQFKLDRSPRRVDLKTYSLQYKQAFWLTIDLMNQTDKPAQITAEASPDGKTLTVTASPQIVSVRIDLKHAPLQGDFDLVWNGHAEKVHGNGVEAQIPTLAAGAPSTGWRKQQLPGPCQDAFNSRFLVVQGTQGTEPQKSEVARQVAQWSKDWDDFGDGVPPVKLDSEITAQDIKGCNLVLFGTPATNSVLSEIADKLPIHIADHRYAVAGKVYEGPDLGLVMCYPNPLDPQHYVLIYSGELWGQKLSINHKHDMLPDFEVFTTKSFGRDDTNDALSAGFFGMNWQLDPSMTWVTQPVAP